MSVDYSSNVIATINRYLNSESLVKEEVTVNDLSELIDNNLTLIKAVIADEQTRESFHKLADRIKKDFQDSAGSELADKVEKILKESAGPSQEVEKRESMETQRADLFEVQPIEAPFSEANFETFTSLLNDRSVEDLEKIRYEMGVMAHDSLFSSVQEARKVGTQPPKLLLINTSAAGKDTHAIASNDGSSKYLAGGLINYGEAKSGLGFLNFDPAEHVRENFEKWDEANVSDINLIAGGEGYASGEKAGEFIVYAGTRDRVSSQKVSAKVNEQPGTPEHRKALQEISAIATLGILLESQGVHPSLLCEKIKEMEGNQIAPKDPLLVKALEVEKFNEKTWEKMMPLLQKVVQENPNQKLSVGESFTSGILASLFTSLEGSSKLFDISLNWYSPQFKKYVGVPDKNVQEDLIAEPETIALATEGLLRKAPETTGITLGTTGWANYWVRGMADYFSVGIAVREEDTVKVNTAKVTVTSSRNASTSKGRRQLTRHLGATTALYMLSKTLSEKYPEEKQFGEMSQSLLEVIHKNGTIEMK